MSTVPRIDFHHPEAAKKFEKALHEIGFAVIENHPIPLQLITEVYQKWQQFFNFDEKYRYPFDKNTHDGFASTELSETAKGHSLRDLKEYYHYFYGGRCPDSLRFVTEKIFAALNNIATILLGWVNDNAPATVSNKFSMPLPEMIKDSHHTLLRPIHYPPLTGTEQSGAVRAAAHEDINLLTVLLPGTEPGLQVKKDGQWLDVPIHQNWLVVNIGDMLQECSNFYYPSTTHRVINPDSAEKNRSRLSMPLFLHPRDEVILSSRHTAKSYREERFRELGLL